MYDRTLTRRRARDNEGGDVPPPSTDDRFVNPALRTLPMQVATVRDPSRRSLFSCGQLLSSALRYGSGHRRPFSWHLTDLCWHHQGPAFPCPLPVAPRVVRYGPSSSAWPPPNGICAPNSP